MQLNPFPNREVLRCPHCRLVQFRSTTGLCRRCHQPLETLHVSLPAGSSPSHGYELSTEPLAKRIGAAVRNLRKERELSQRQLATAMGTVRSHISKIERGLLVPSFQTLDRATSALGIDIADLLRRSCQKKPPGSPRGC
jgi:ribosome-binding protein aMBF1 (putative translation factor)